MSDPNVTITPNMLLPVPDLTDPGPDYASNVNESLVIIDGHTHDGSPGDGKQIDLSQQLCEGELSLNGHDLTNVRSVEFDSQPSVLSGSQDVNCIYVNQNNLGFNNSNGIFIPITNGNTLAITSLSLTNFAPRNISSSATILNTDTYNLVNVDSSGGAITITLPICATITPVAAMRLYIIRDVGEDAGANNITIQVASGSGNVFADSGATTFVLNSNGGYVGIYTDGVSQWFTFTQNTFNQEVMSMNSSSLNINAGGFINVNASAVEVNNGSAINLSGATLSIHTGSDEDVSNSTINIHNSVVTSDTSTQTYFNTSTFTRFAVGSVLVVNGNLEGTTTGGNLNIAGTGAINSQVNGGLQSQAVGGINTTVQGGIRDGGIYGGIQSTVDGGIQNAGGSGDWVSFLTPRNRTVRFPLIANFNGYYNNFSPAGPWTNQPNFGLSGDNTFWQPAWAQSDYMPPPNLTQVFYLPTMHNGATLSTVRAQFNVGGVPLTLSGMPLPQITVYRCDMTAGQPVPASNKDFLSATHTQTFPTPASPNAFHAGGLLQDLVYTCDRNNVIDTSRYVYYLGLTDNSGPVSQQQNSYFTYALDYTNITDMRFE